MVGSVGLVQALCVLLQVYAWAIFLSSSSGHICLGAAMVFQVVDEDGHAQSVG